MGKIQNKTRYSKRSQQYEQQYDHFSYPKVDDSFYIWPPPQVTYRDLHPTSEEYLYVQNLMNEENMIVVDRIQAIDNQYLDELYNWKYFEKQQEYGQVTEYLLFHATKWHSIDDICTYNFNWRMTRKHRYGWGVCFSKSPLYASQFSDSHPEMYKVMVGAKVIVGKVCKGHRGMVIPPAGYDTSSNKDGLVVVKYEDHEFLPIYRINYHMKRDDKYFRNRRAYRFHPY